MISTLHDRHTSSASPGRTVQWARTLGPAEPRDVMRQFDLSNFAEEFPALANLVEDIADWDIVDASVARGTNIMVLPGTMPHLAFQYRTQIESSRKFGDATMPHNAFQYVASTIRTGVVTISPQGPLGLIIVRLKPEAATFLLGDHLYEFADTKVTLNAIFGASAVASLEDRLMEARSSADRIVAVLRFISANMCSHQPDPVVCRAAANLRRDPFLRLAPLAAELGLSERHLLRRFKAVFGMGPKRFARDARVEHVFASCGRGSGWANIARSCGFTDQPHMVNDFKAILGATPAHFFRSTRRAT